MKYFYLAVILISFSLAGKGQEKNRTILPTDEILSLYRAGSVSNVFHYLKKHHFKPAGNRVRGSFHNYYYEKGKTAFWVSVSGKQSYDLSYYPTSPDKISGVIADLVSLKYKLADSKSKEDDIVKSQCNSYHKDGVFVEVDSFYNKILKAATYSVIISDRTFL